MSIENIKNIVEIIAFSAAGIYFIYKLIDGWGLINLSVELAAERRIGNTNDLITILLTLKKGDRGSLALASVELRCISNNRNPEVVRIPLIYPLKIKSEDNFNDENTIVHWDKVDETRPHIHLTPGESTQYSHIFEIPNGEKCTVEAIVVGKRPVSTRYGQWRASIAIV